MTSQAAPDRALAWYAAAVARRGVRRSAQVGLPGWPDGRLYLPAYQVAEAARLARSSQRTIARWRSGEARPGYRMAPVLPGARGLLSYLDLVEVAFVADLRRSGIALGRLRRAHAYLRRAFGAEHPFAQFRFKSDGVHVLAELAGPADADLVAADGQGQIVWTAALTERFDQFDYESGLARRWYPRGREAGIVVDPRLAFGAPVVAGTGVPTRAVVQRQRAGMATQEIERDLGLAEAQVLAALELEAEPSA